MEKYLMMLYVTLDQEKALKAFFSKHGWLFCKPDLSRLTDKLGPFVVPADARDEDEIDVDDGDTLQTKSTNSKTTPKKKRVYAKRKCTAKRKCAAKKTKVETYNMTDSEESVQEIPDSIPSTSTVLHDKTIRHDHEETLPLVMHCDNGDKVGIKCERIDSELTEEIKLGTANDSDLTATVSYIDSQNVIESDVGRQRSKLPYKPTDTNKDLKKDVISTKDDDDDGNETINDDDDNDDDYGTINDNNDDNNEMHDDANNETIENDDAEMFGNDKDSLDGTLENSGLEAIVDSLSTTDTEGADLDNTGDGLSQTDKKKIKTKKYHIRSNPRNTAFKLEAVEYAKTHGNRAAGIKYGVLTDLIYTWRKNEKELNEIDLTRQRRNSFNSTFKLEAVQYAKTHGNRAAGRKYKISEANVRLWRKHENELLDMDSTRARIRYDDIKSPYQGIEKSLVEWIRQEKLKDPLLRHEDIKTQAFEIAKENGISSFKASDRWFDKFLKKNNFYKCKGFILSLYKQ